MKLYASRYKSSWFLKVNETLIGFLSLSRRNTFSCSYQWYCCYQKQVSCVKIKLYQRIWSHPCRNSFSVSGWAKSHSRINKGSQKRVVVLHVNKFKNDISSRPRDLVRQESIGGATSFDPASLWCVRNSISLNIQQQQRPPHNAESRQSEYQMQQQLNHTPLKIELRAAGLDVACIDCRFFLWRKSDAPPLRTCINLYMYSQCKKGCAHPFPSRKGCDWEGIALIRARRMYNSIKRNCQRCWCRVNFFLFIAHAWGFAQRLHLACETLRSFSSTRPLCVAKGWRVSDSIGINHTLDQHTHLFVQTEY